MPYVGRNDTVANVFAKGLFEVAYIVQRYMEERDSATQAELEQVVGGEDPARVIADLVGLEILAQNGESYVKGASFDDLTRMGMA